MVMQSREIRVVAMGSCELRLRDISPSLPMSSLCRVIQEQAGFSDPTILRLAQRGTFLPTGKETVGECGVLENGPIVVFEDENCSKTWIPRSCESVSSSSSSSSSSSCASSVSDGFQDEDDIDDECQVLDPCQGDVEAESEENPQQGGCQRGIRSIIHMSRNEEGNLYLKSQNVGAKFWISAMDRLRIKLLHAEPSFSEMELRDATEEVADRIAGFARAFGIQVYRFDKWFDVNKEDSVPCLDVNNDETIDEKANDLPRVNPLHSMSPMLCALAISLLGLFCGLVAALWMWTDANSFFRMDEWIDMKDRCGRMIHLID